MQHQTTNRDERDRPEPIATERIESREQRKIFYLDLLQNDRGRVLRIKEKGGVRPVTIMVPDEVLAEMGELIQKLAAWSAKNP